MPSESFGNLPEQSTFLRLHHTLTRVENIIALIPTVEIMFNITESNQRPKSNPKETFQNFDWTVILPKGQGGE
ncbi:hypothetical protein HZH68_003332 [Vespula germanica]|uniref:Uncharacterized protein n=1 Tax=Vespula germanica TaxID=30212 RepID=A0A834NNX5_VESGE|nr:hypothetical protein HZH68_003332 [Vespula germanica]